MKSQYCVLFIYYSFSVLCVVYLMILLFFASPQTLELLYGMTNQENVQVIVKRMIQHLERVADTYIRADLVVKVMEVAHKYPCYITTGGATGLTHWSLGKLFVVQMYTFQAHLYVINNSIITEDIHVLWRILLRQHWFSY